MPYTLEDHYRDYLKQLLETLPPEKLLEGVSTEDLERLLQQRRAAEAASKTKTSGQPGRGSPKRRRK